MVEKSKEKTQNLQEQLKSITFKHLPESDTDYRQARMSKNEWLIKLVRRQGEESEGKRHRLPSGVTILLTRLILSMDRDDPSSLMSASSSLSDNQLDIFLCYN